ncbi:MAG: RNA polymerase sigma-70 factor [Saprospiraceae bacterium]
MPENDNVLDQELLLLIKKGDNAAFRQIFDRYYKYIVVTVYKISSNDELAHDIAQDVFLQIWNKRETIEIQGDLKSYLRRAAINKTYNFFKASRIDFRDEADLPETKDENSPDEIVMKDERNQMINNAIEALPEKCRIVFQLRRIEGSSHQEIADKLGISKKTIENHLTKAMKLLRETLQSKFLE